MNKAIILLLGFLFASCASNLIIVKNTTEFNSSVNNEVIRSNQNSTLEIKENTKSKYEKPKISDGLYYGATLFESDNAALVISFDNKPIPPKSNEPDSQTIPGFYPQGDKRFPFSEIKVIQNQVYFKTNSVEGLSFEFKGTTGKEWDKELNTFVPFITGVVNEFRDNRSTRKQKIYFGHAVVY